MVEGLTENSLANSEAGLFDSKIVITDKISRPAREFLP